MTLFSLGLRPIFFSSLFAPFCLVAVTEVNGLWVLYPYHFCICTYRGVGRDQSSPSYQLLGSRRGLFPPSHGDIPQAVSEGPALGWQGLREVPPVQLFSLLRPDTQTGGAVSSCVTTES